MSAVAGTSAPNFFGKTCGRWGLTKPTPSQKGVPLALRCAEALRRKPSPTLSVSSSGKVALGYSAGSTAQPPPSVCSDFGIGQLPWPKYGKLALHCGSDQLCGSKEAGSPGWYSLPQPAE